MTRVAAFVGVAALLAGCETFTPFVVDLPKPADLGPASPVPEGPAVAWFAQGGAVCLSPEDALAYDEWATVRVPFWAVGVVSGYDFYRRLALSSGPQDTSD